MRSLDEFSTEAEKRAYLESYDPKGLRWAIASFPDAKFVLGHAGFDFHGEGYDFSEAVFRLAKAYPNVYVEISAFGHPIFDPSGEVMDRVLQRLRDENLLDRTIYGSDGPVVPTYMKTYRAKTLESMARLGFSAEEIRMVMHGNARRIYRLESFFTQ